MEDMLKHIVQALEHLIGAHQATMNALPQASAGQQALNAASTLLAKVHDQLNPPEPEEKPAEPAAMAPPPADAQEAGSDPAPHEAPAAEPAAAPPADPGDNSADDLNREELQQLQSGQPAAS